MPPRKKVVLVVDSGSGSMKFGEATLQKKTGKILSVSYYDSPMPLAEDLSNHKLALEIEREGKIYNMVDENGNPLDMCGLFAEHSIYKASDNSSREIHTLYGNRFSEDIKSQYLDRIISTVRKIKLANPSEEIEFRLAGTAALRKANDGKDLLRVLDNRLKEEGIINVSLKIISQREEGIFAFKSVQHELSNPGALVLDAGGGSRQFTALNTEGQVEVLGDAFASAAAREVIAGIAGTEDGSIYPFTGDARQAIESLKPNIKLEESLADKKIKEGAQVIGAGNIYSSLLSLMKHNGLKSSEAVSYSKDDVIDLITLFSNKDKDQVTALIPKEDRPFTENILTNMMLVVATMETHNIPELRVVKVSNAQALIADAIEEHTRKDIVDITRTSIDQSDNTSYLASPQLTKDPIYDSTGLFPLLTVVNSWTGNLIGKAASLFGLELSKTSTPMDSTPVAPPKVQPVIYPEIDEKQIENWKKATEKAKPVVLKFKNGVVSYEEAKNRTERREAERNKKKKDRSI